MVDPAAVLAAPGVAPALERSADPPMARTMLSRVFEAHPELAEIVRDQPLVRDALIAIACASRSLTTALVHDATLVETLEDPDAFSLPRDADEYRLLLASDGVADPAALRRWKRRELLRIAARDLLGRSDLPTVGRELAALAEACLAGALAIAEPAVAIAVIGMGKLGGSELNYSSDVDVLFVHDGPSAEAERTVRRVLHVMAEPTADGIVFRTDADLRPEGRSGALSRTVDGYVAYWERWAQTWEFQALLKARPVAGDHTLGTELLARAQPFVWPEVLPPDAVREVRVMKERAEGETRRRGLTERELKRGRGGIRDIEFAVQLLQLVHGRHDPSIRSATTLEALAQLVHAGYVDIRDGAPLSDAYRFLRTVEHRLQLWDEQQTHTLPTEDVARLRLARVLGYRGRTDESAIEQFEADHRRHQAQVRSIHEKLFFGPLLDTLAGRPGPLNPDAAEERLRAFGFLDLAATRAAFAELTRGLTRTSRLMGQLLPVLLEWCSESPDPDLALLQLRRLAEGPTRAGNLARAFREGPGAAERTCRLLGSSRLLGDALRHQPEFVATLSEDDVLGKEKTRERLVEEAIATVQWRVGDTAARRSGLRRFKRRELLRIASRDLLSFADLATTGRELSHLAEACLEAALVGLRPTIPFAIIGMGRFGGLDLSYASDLDVVFVYEGDGAGAFNEAERVAVELIAEIGATTTEGQIWTVDAGLRPEGKDGQLARSLGGYCDYWEHWALTWELQALIKARFAAGTVELGARFLAAAEPFVYRADFSDEQIREVRRMKARIERERIPPGDDPQFHLKLGRGSLSDVEFTVQLEQLRHGADHSALRTPETLQALDALVRDGLLDSSDADVLRESLRFCLVARSYRYLLTGGAHDSLPTAPDEAEKLGRMLGYVHRPNATLRDDYRRLTRRARAVVDRVFYERAS
ncbi:MAG: bifunctional [glutamine synthetase] adenylyltransferase/[glutamine synthetase]-adenylyl-L-tyrosine phosphorylase [Acidimicrobiia bacterium]